MTTRSSSTVSATNPPYGPYVEFGHAIKSQAEKITDLEQELNKLKQAHSQNDVLCKAYTDLHRLRFFSLLLFPIMTLFIIGLFLYNTNSNDETTLWIFRILGIILSASILKEALSLPNQIKSFEEKLNKIDTEVKKISSTQPVTAIASEKIDNKPTRGRPRKSP